MKFVNRALAFFKDLFSNKTDTDPKYVVGIFCTLLWGIMVIYHLWSKVNVQSELIWGNIGLIAACFGLDVINSKNVMNSKWSMKPEDKEEDKKEK